MVLGCVVNREGKRGARERETGRYNYRGAEGGSS